MLAARGAEPRQGTVPRLAFDAGPGGSGTSSPRISSRTAKPGWPGNTTGAQVAAWGGS